jgi:hypothetical protein
MQLNFDPLCVKPCVANSKARMRALLLSCVNPKRAYAQALRGLAHLSRSHIAISHPAGSSTMA